METDGGAAVPQGHAFMDTEVPSLCHGAFVKKGVLLMGQIAGRKSFSAENTA